MTTTTDLIAVPRNEDGTIDLPALRKALTAGLIEPSLTTEDFDHNREAIEDIVATIEATEKEA